MSIRSLFANKRPNILLILNDQQRAVQHWPAGWAAEHLPSLDRLRRHGMSFDLAMTVACACSASRASLLTSTYPTEHGVKNTLTMPDEAGMAQDPGGLPLNLNQLNPTQINLARILEQAGYTAVWKGKWHLSNPVDGGNEWTEADIEYMRTAYGFSGWNPADAGNSESKVKTLGGGVADNDTRYTKGGTPSAAYSPTGESAETYLQNWQPDDGPFFLTVSYVNPHDVWVAPTFPEGSGYSADDVPDYGLEVPDTVDEDLDLKPVVQAYFKTLMALGDAGGGASMDDSDSQSTYVNFYAWLQTLVDAHVMRLLDLLDAKGLTNDTLIIRMADHGEMGLSHGLREKEFVAYDEAIRIPFIVSNPIAFPTPADNASPVANIDLAPTLAALTGVADRFDFALRGVDLTPILAGETDSLRDAVHFMTDDASAPAPTDADGFPTFLRAIRTREWLYTAVYNAFGSDTRDDPTVYQYELYDLQADPSQSTNLAGQADYADQQKTLHAMLIEAMQANRTVPPGFVLWTPALQAAIDEDEADDQDNPVTNPIWPTPDDAVSAAQQYVEAGGWPGMAKSLLKAALKGDVEDQVKAAIKAMWKDRDD